MVLQLKRNGGAGIRTNAKTKGNSAFLEKSGAESGALEVLELWSHLTPSQIEAILSIVRKGIYNRFKCGNLSCVISVDGLIDAGRLA